MPTPYEIAEEFRQALLRREQTATDEIVQSYQSVLTRLEDLLSGLTAQIDSARGRNEVISASWLTRQDRYTALLTQINSEIDRFGSVVDNRVTASQRGAIVLAENAAFDATTLAVSSPGFVFNRLPVDAFQNVVGYLGDGSPLSSLLNQLAPDAATDIGDTLKRGVALGWNPEKTRREIMQIADVPLTRARAISRTETLRAYNQASIQAYQANDTVVIGWRWIASLTPRTCPVCIAMHGTIHPLDEEFGSHVNCRCTPSPVVRGASETDFETGVDWFARQEESVQNAMLGATAADAYRRGLVTLPDFVGMKTDDQWGLTRYKRSLSSVLTSV